MFRPIRRPTRRPNHRVVGASIACAAALVIGAAGCGSSEPETSAKHRTAGERADAGASATSTTGAASDSSTTSAPSSSGSTPATTPTDLNGWRPAPLTWKTCSGHRDFSCTTLVVPANWSNTGGPQLKLAVARKNATGKRIGSLFTNPGGPGGSGIDFLYEEPFDDALTSRFDIVSWDPRGVGASTAFGCNSHVEKFLANDPDPDTPAEQSAIDADAKAVADDCGHSNPDLVGNVGTDNVARDLEALRIALGEQRLNYVGFSYGTLVGLRYLALYPTHVRALVLDGVVDPTAALVEWLRGQTIAIDASVSRALASCTKATNCPVPDAAAAYDKVQKMVETKPIRAGRQTLGPAELETAAVYVSYDPSLWKQLGPALKDAEGGDGRAMLKLAQGYYDFGGFTSYVAVECLDSAHPTGSAEYRTFADELRRLSPRIGGSTANELLPCAYWPTPPQPISAPVTGAGSPPILVLGNRGDAATPYADSVKVASMLADGHLVSYAGEGHTSYGRSSCVDAAVNAYLIDLKVPKSDPDCH